ncbi:MAG: efflux RND transporter periplasmic adaptor subunit [Tannerella sp.]|jgi:RND family efflux transporter MFP subunit|nr:efflux RND transporter periplasmic adaptor subunit [Tannerella sp.]
MKRYNMLVIGLFIGIIACSDGKKGDGEDDQSVETVLPDIVNEVTVIPLTLSEFNHELISNGKLSAKQSADLRFASSEPVAAIYVKNGDRVSKGAKIAELSAFRLNNRTAQAKDALDRAKLELQDVLIGQGFALVEDSSKAPPATMQLARTKSGYEQALVQYQLALYEEENAVLTAPFDGIVANLFAKPFNTASVTDVFCTILDSRNLEASFSVLESELPLIRTGDKVIVTPFALPDGKTEGRISEINPLVDVNGMVQVKASVVNSGKLFEGMNVRVSIQRLLGKQLVIPKEALVLRSGKQVVFTLDKGKAFWNYVHTGLENAGHYTIVDGLKDGDVVITGGNINLAHETTVKVVDSISSEIQ